MLSHLPPRLKFVLSKLGVLMSQDPGGGSQHLGMMPENLDVWEGSAVGRQIIKFQGGARLCSHNQTMCAFSGAHNEELATRINSSEVGLFTSEFRTLCMHLFLLLARSQGVQQLSHFVPFYGGFCRRTSVHHPILLHRVTRTFYQDGVVNTGCIVTPDEYNAGMRQHSHGRMEFVDCDMPGEELTGEILGESEQIRHMVTTEAGRARLDRLADRVIDKFQLQIPPGALPPLCSTTSSLVGSAATSRIPSPAQAAASSRSSPAAGPSRLSPVGPQSGYSPQYSPQFSPSAPSPQHATMPRYS